VIITASNTPTYDQEQLYISWKQGNNEYKIQCPDISSYMEIYKQCKIHLHSNISIPEFKLVNHSVMSPFSSSESSDYLSGETYTLKRNNSLLEDKLIEEEEPPPISIENQVPYMKAITTLRNIVNERSPRDKLGCILNTFRQTIKCVTDFWDKEGCDPIVGADDLVPIFAYVILKANIPNLYTEMNFIWEFATDTEMNGNFGYGFATFQVGVEVVARLDENPPDDKDSSTQNQNNQPQTDKLNGIIEKREQLFYTRRLSRATRIEEEEFTIT